MGRSVPIQEMPKRALAILLEKLWSRVVHVDGCLLYTGARSTKGYGSIRNKHGIYSTHRLVYIIAIGIPRSKSHYVVDHMCSQKACCNPDHLRLVPSFVNASENTKWTRRELCANGHLMIKANRRVANYKNGRPHTHCRLCYNEQQMRYYRNRQRRRRSGKDTTSYKE